MPVVVAAAVKVRRGERVELERMARSSLLPHRVVAQASGLLAADGMANDAIADLLQTFVQRLHDEVRRAVVAGDDYPSVGDGLSDGTTWSPLPSSTIGSGRGGGRVVVVVVEVVVVVVVVGACVAPEAR